MDVGTKPGWFFARPGCTGGSDRVPYGKSPSEMEVRLYGIFYDSISLHAQYIF
jgi:hypothetical protein